MSRRDAGTNGCCRGIALAILLSFAAGSRSQQPVAAGSVGLTTAHLEVFVAETSGRPVGSLAPGSVSAEQGGVKLSLSAGVGTETHVLLLARKNLMFEAGSRAKVAAMLRRGWSVGVVSKSGDVRYCSTERALEGVDWAAEPTREEVTAALTGLSQRAGRRVVVAQDAEVPGDVLMAFSYRLPEVYEILSEKTPGLAKGEWQSLRDRPVGVGLGDQSPLIGPDFRPLPDTLTRTNNPVTEQHSFAVTTPAGIWWRGSARGALDAVFAQAKGYYDFTMTGKASGVESEAMTVSVRGLEPGVSVSAAVYRTTGAATGLSERVVAAVVPKVDVIARDAERSR